ncbi:hypothetical protein YC2023_039544 [Brassica napus]
MTQKYAVKVNAGDGSSTSLQIQETPNAGEVKSHGDEKVSESGIRVLARNHENPDGIKPNLASRDTDQHMDGNGKRKAVVGICEANTSGVRSSAAKSDNNRLSGKLFLRPLGESQLNEVSKAEVLAQTEMNENQDPKSWGEEFEKSVLEEASMPESIVVLDSEESGGEEEEATVSLKSRLSLARRGLQCGIVAESSIGTFEATIGVPLARWMCWIQSLAYGSALLGAIHSRSSPADIYGIIRDIKYLSSTFTYVVFNFIPRAQNSLADGPAKSAYTGVSSTLTGKPNTEIVSKREAKSMLKRKRETETATKA